MWYSHVFIQIIYTSSFTVSHKFLVFYNAYFKLNALASLRANPLSSIIGKSTYAFNVSLVGFREPGNKVDDQSALESRPESYHECGVYVCYYTSCDNVTIKRPPELFFLANRGLHGCCKWL